MKRLILKVKDKTKVHSLKNICEIVYVSKFINVIGIEISEEKISELKKDQNIISIRESEEGIFQPSLITC